MTHQLAYKNTISSTKFNLYLFVSLHISIKESVSLFYLNVKKNVSAYNNYEDALSSCRTIKL